MKKITIEFPNKELAKAFAEWLCDGGGEEGFMDAVDDDFPSIRLGYHGLEDKAYPRNDGRRYGKFMCDQTIRVEILPPEQP